MAVCCLTSAAVLALSTSGPAGPAARRINDLWLFMLVAGTAVFILFAVLLVVGLRRRAPSTDDGAEEQQARAWLVGGGVLLPLVVVLAVLVVTIDVMRDIPERTRTNETVLITGHRWWWEVEYRGHGISTRNEVHIPAGEPVQIELRSADVIHSFWIPALAGKRDLLPERTNYMVIEADRPGRYEGQCAEFCGLGHATMRVVVVAHERAEFDRWVAGRRTA